MRRSPQACLFFVFIAFLLITSLPIPVSASYSSEYEDVNLGYLTAHIEDFCGVKIRTRGIVNYLNSYYMFEDFWLGGIPVVVRFAGLPKPSENSSVEVYGTVEYCEVEGGFCYLNAHSWIYAGETNPEFQSFLFLPMFIISTLVAIIVLRRRCSVRAISV